MGILDKIFDSLAEGSPTPIALPDALVFSSLDQASITRRLKIHEKAEIDGRHNVPPSDTTRFGATEESIQATILEEVRANLQNYDAQQAAYSHRLAMLDPFGLAAKYRGEAQRRKVEIQAKITQEQGNFFLIKQSIQIIENDWLGFKRKWGITHEPKLGIGRIWKVFAIVALIFIEAIVNGALIGPYTAGGIVEGFAIAIIFPLLTLLLFALPTGLLIRKTVRPGRLVLRLAWPLISIIFAIAAVSLNLLLAYIREAVTQTGEWEQGMPLWLATLQLNFQPLSTASFLLFLFSSGLFVLAVVDFYLMDHPIPGLMDKLRERIRRHEEYGTQLKRAHDDLLSLHRDSALDFKGIYDMLTTWQVEYNNIQHSRIKLWNMLRAYINQVERVTNSLLTEYQQSNRQFRTTPTPEYFRNSWSFPDVISNTPPVLVPGEVYGKKMSEALASIQETQDDLNEVYSEIPKILQGVDSMLHEVRA